MTFFAVYDEKGAITQGTKVYDPEGYANRLRGLNYRFVERKTETILSHEHWHVTRKRLKERPTMTVAIDKAVVRAGGSDAAVLTGAPKGVAFSITVRGVSVWNGVLPDGELELTVPAPGLYDLTLTKWPFKDFRVTIEAVA